MAASYASRLSPSPSSMMHVAVAPAPVTVTMAEVWTDDGISVGDSVSLPWPAACA